MLAGFRVENYRSFNGESKLTLLAGASRDHEDHLSDIGGRPVLPLVAVFGANGSGKSNLIDAIRASRRIILYDRRPDPSECCRVVPGSADRPTSFGYTIIIDGTWYDYGFETVLSTGSIRSEWLRDLSHQGGALSIFRRTSDDITSDIALSDEEKQFFFVYKDEALHSDRLFLSTIIKMRSVDTSAFAPASRVFLWFMNSLLIVSPPYLGGGSSIRLSSSSRRLLPGYGTGVTDVRFEDIGMEEAGISDDFIRRLFPGSRRSGTRSLHINDELYEVSFDEGGDPRLQHALFYHEGTSFRYSEESDGTRRLIDLLSMLDPENGGDMTYIVDELETSLHPQLTRKLVSDFLEAAPSMRRQIILTTHESRLMDLDLLRRDEIWFVDKNVSGVSDLYSLEDFNERKDRRVDKAYLEGRYGGVPLFDRFYPNLE